MGRRRRYGHLQGDTAYFPYAARTGLRRRQRRTARLLVGIGLLALAAAGLLVVRQSLLHGGQPAPPPADAPAASAAPATPDPVAVRIRLATAGIDGDALAVGQDDGEPLADPSPFPSPDARAVAEVLPRYQELYAQNPDLAGWLRIEGTDIDLPVVYRAGDHSYYLRRGYDRLYATGGTLFLDGRCRPGLDGTRPSANWLVYGHNMADGSMFGTLSRYAEEAFYLEHPTFTFDTLYEEGQWQVLAALRTTLGADPLPYYAFFDAADRAEWQAWMDAILPLSLYDTGVQPEYGRQLLTLSTCGDTRTGTDARFAVLAMRVGVG